jgi:hypothetical protein
MNKAIWISCIMLLFSGCYFEERMPVEMVSMSRSQPLAQEKSLESIVRFDIGSLEITGEEKAGSLYSFDLDYDKSGYAPDIQYDPSLSGSEARFSFRLRRIDQTGIRKEIANNRLCLAFTDAIPLKLQLTTGVGDACLSLSGIKLARLEFEVGVGGAKIYSYDPNAIQCEYIRLKSGVGSIEATGLGNLNFREFEFAGGVGGADLDFTGEWKQNADIRIEEGVGGVNVRMPRNLGVRVEAEKHFLSGFHLEGFHQRDSVYYSENYETAPIRATVRVETGVGGFKITWE